MKRQLVFLLLIGEAFESNAGAKDEWRSARPGWQYQFPRDHHAHTNFKTEWWYFTGNLFDDRGRRFGYELTFFREGIVPPAERTEEQSRFVVNDLKFAHFTITDGNGRRFLFDEKASRGAFGEAGFDRGDKLAWIDDWSVKFNANGEFELSAAAANMKDKSAVIPSREDGEGPREGTAGGRAVLRFAQDDKVPRADGVLKLTLTPVKAPVIHGENGVSAKAAGEGHGSQYYSITRLTSRGRLRLEGKTFHVSGTSWFDHEWATNQLAPHQVGWNWLCLQFADNTELMLYQMRRDDGTADPASSATFVATDGNALHLRAADFSMTSGATWKSEKTGAIYPVEWRVKVPSHGIDVVVQPVLKNQELAFVPLTYWEGAVDVSGTLTGFGYLELTGYTGGLSALNR